MAFSEKTISSDTVFCGKVFDICCQEVLLDDNTKAYREVVIHHGGAGILAVDEEKNVYLVRQYRKGAECEMLEIPAGKLEKGENPTECAVRELEEEIGAVASRVTFLCEFFPTPAYCSEKISVFLATGLTITTQHLDNGELLELVKLPFDKVFEMVMSGEITDAKTIISILKAKEIFCKN